jgi:hypothetical protein
MINRNNIGKKFALTGCKAWIESENEETLISGLFIVEDIVYLDRTCGQHESGYWVFRDDLQPDAPMFFVDALTFCEQTDPRGYIDYIESEKWQARKEEQMTQELEPLFASGYPIDSDDFSF